MKNIILLPLAGLISFVVVVGGFWLFTMIAGIYLGPILYFLLALIIIGYSMDRRR